MTGIGISKKDRGAKLHGHRRRVATLPALFAVTILTLLGAFFGFAGTAKADLLCINAQGGFSTCLGGVTPVGTVSPTAPPQPGVNVPAATAPPATSKTPTSTPAASTPAATVPATVPLAPIAQSVTVPQGIANTLSAHRPVVGAAIALLAADAIAIVAVAAMRRRPVTSTRSDVSSSTLSPAVAGAAAPKGTR